GSAIPPTAILRQNNVIGTNVDRAVFYQGDIAEVLVFNQPISAAVRQSYEAYLNRRYYYTPPPPAPLISQTSTASSTQVSLSWTDPDTSITGYRIERQSGATGSWTTLGSVAGNVTTYADTTIVAGQIYAYRVTASNTAGSSPPSAIWTTG